MLACRRVRQRHSSTIWSANRSSRFLQTSRLVLEKHVVDSKQSIDSGRIDPNLEQATSDISDFQKDSRPNKGGHDVGARLVRVSPRDYIAAPDNDSNNEDNQIDAPNGIAKPKPLRKAPAGPPFVRTPLTDTQRLKTRHHVPPRLEGVVPEIPESGSLQSSLPPAAIVPNEGRNGNEAEKLPFTVNTAILEKKFERIKWSEVNSPMVVPAKRQTRWKHPATGKEVNRNSMQSVAQFEAKEGAQSKEPFIRHMRSLDLNASQGEVLPVSGECKKQSTVNPESVSRARTRPKYNPSPLTTIEETCASSSETQGPSSPNDAQHAEPQPSAIKIHRLWARRKPSQQAQSTVASEQGHQAEDKSKITAQETHEAQKHDHKHTSFLSKIWTKNASTETAIGNLMAMTGTNQETRWNESEKSVPKVRTRYLGHKEPQQFKTELWQDTFSEICNQVAPENVLSVSSISHSVVEADFIRTVLRRTGVKPFARVIPLRDRGTLEKMDKYLVIFHSKTDLDAWRAHIEHLYKLSNKYTMKSLLHPIVPPQDGFKIKGVKVDEVVKSFALVPAGSVVHTNHESHLHKTRHAIAQAGGYTGIVRHDGLRRHPVMLRIAGVRDLKITDVLQGIMYDGEMRNLAWQIVLRTKGKISSTHEWNNDFIPTQNSDSSQPLEPVTSDSQKRAGDIAEVPVVMDDFEASSVFGTAKQKSGISELEQDNSLIPSANAFKFHDGQRWIVYFDSDREAQLFARTWHCRPFPFPPLDDPRYQHSEEARGILERDQGQSIKVFTEALW